MMSPPSCYAARRLVLPHEVSPTTVREARLRRVMR